MVQEKQLAASIQASSDYPGSKYPNLFVISATPRAPHTTVEVEQAVYEELDRLKREPVSPHELQKILNQVDASLVRALRSNRGMASYLAYFQAISGDWRGAVKRPRPPPPENPGAIRRAWPPHA